MAEITKGEQCSGRAERQAKQAESEVEQALGNIAIKACKEINPENPQAVAESIKEMYEALEAVRQVRYSTSGDAYTKAFDKVEQVLAKAKGKPIQPVQGKP